MINNIKKEIEHFLKEFCLIVPKEAQDFDAYNELLMDDHKCIEYEDVQYYIPENCSLMDENDQLLHQLLIATFIYES